MEYPRTIWVVRHAEREDNINRSWRKQSAAAGLSGDNSPLSSRGRFQAEELGKRFASIDISHVFASPFDRTVETACAIVRANKNKELLVKPEPGLCEALYLCDKPFPSFWDASKLKEKFDIVDDDYDPVFSKGFGDDACVPRLRTTLQRLCARFSGPILLLGHGASIGALHEVVSGDFTYVGQATVSKFVEVAEGEVRVETSSDASHLSDKSNLRPY